MPPDSSEMLGKRRLHMSEYELLMIVFTVIGLLIAIYSASKK